MSEPALVTIRGIGGTCTAVDSNCVIASDGAPAWRIATVELEAVAPGDVELHLQIGEDGMRHEFLPGDYGGDSDVDDDDYVVWRSSFGAVTEGMAVLPADGNRNDTVDAADYTWWRNNLDASPVLESSADSFALFGTDAGGEEEPIYNAGFMADREITLPMDDFDAVIHVIGLVAGSHVDPSKRDAGSAIIPELSSGWLACWAALSMG
jgi:hypothetical protein